MKARNKSRFMEMKNIHLFQWLFMAVTLVAACSCLQFRFDRQKVNFPLPAIASLENKVNEVYRKLRHFFDITRENNRKVLMIKRSIYSVLNYAKEDTKKYEMKCPVTGAVIDISRDNCLLYRDIRFYGRNWKDARQYCLQRGGDLAQPLIHDSSYVNDFLRFFPVLAELRADVYIGTRAVMGMTDYHYEYLNGLTIRSDNVHFRNSSNGNPDWGFVAALSIPIIPEHGLEINDRESTEIRGFICEFQLKPFVPKYKPILNHIDDIDESLEIDPEHMFDVEAPLEEPASMVDVETPLEESEESTEHDPPIMFSDFEDEIPCEGRCSNIQVCNYVADRCEPLSSCNPFCSVGEICSSDACSTSCDPVCSDGSVCNIAASECETVDSCGNVCNSNQRCDDISRTCLYTCCDCDEELECNPISGRCEVFNLVNRRSVLNITKKHRTRMNEERKGGSSEPKCDNSCLNHQRCNSDNECEDVCDGGCPLDQLCNIHLETCLPIDDCCQNCAAGETCSEVNVQNCFTAIDQCGVSSQSCFTVITNSCS